MNTELHSTTIVCVRRDGRVALGGDGQVTLNDMVVKSGANKVRRLGGGKALAGFAGGVADAFTLFDLFEAELEKHRGQLSRAAVELARAWRTEQRLRRLDALLAVADLGSSLLISGNGEVIEPEHGLIAIGSGGPYALAAARALLAETEYDARTVAEKALDIAAEICVYTNSHRSIEELKGDE